MAEENDGGEVSLEGNLLTNRIQDLVSSSDPSQTDNKTHAEALEFISSILTERYKGRCTLIVYSSENILTVVLIVD